MAAFKTYQAYCERNCNPCDVSAPYTISTLDESVTRHRRNFVAIEDHSLAPQQPWFIGKYVHFTVMRNPINRMLSNLIYDYKNNHYGYGQVYERYAKTWLTTHPDNFIVRYLNGFEGMRLPKYGVNYKHYVMARKQLPKFSAMIILEAYTETLPLLKYKFNWSYTDTSLKLNSYSANEMSAKVWQWYPLLLFEMNYFDLLLYRDAVRLAKKQLQQAVIECPKLPHCKHLVAGFTATLNKLSFDTNKGNCSNAFCSI